jgi:large subunit ribosomal protein L21
MYAIIEDSGRQFKVSSGDRIRLDRPLADQSGAQPEKLTLERVLLVAGEGSPKVGAPLVAGAKVEAEVLGWVKAKKLDIQKYRRRKGYHRKKGHRQNYLEVRVTSITA